MGRSVIKNPVQPGDGDPRHGSASTYTNHVCRCDLCRAAWAQAQQRRKDARVLRLSALPPDQHGKASTYSNHSCRCRACTDASTACKRQWRRTQRASR